MSSAVPSRVLLVLVAAAFGLWSGCKGGATQSPQECMQKCDQQCPYTPDGLGDNEDYIECLEACEGKCGGG